MNSIGQRCFLLKGVGFRVPFQTCPVLEDTEW